MRLKFIIRIILFVLLFSSCKENQSETRTISSYIPLNKSQNILVDSSNLFSSLESDSLTKKIIEYEKTSTNEVVILTIDSLPNNTNIQYYSTQVANSWGIGKKVKRKWLINYYF